MATKVSAVKTSKRSARDSTKQRPASEEPEAATEPKPEPTHKPEPRPLALDSAPSLAERVQAQREQLYKAMSIVECCKYASATLYAVDDSEYMVPAFDTICDLLDTAAGELERIASDCEDLD